jgi:hypothetical protein
LRECRGLREQASIYERDREVGIRLPFDHDAAVDEVVADWETHHLDVEVFALSRQTEYCGVSFRKVNAKLMASPRDNRRIRPRFRRFAVSIFVRHLPGVSSWRGKPKVHGRV